MQQKRRNYQRPVRNQSYSRRVDSFVAAPSRQSAQYQRRSNGIIPSTESEYMIALGGSAARRHHTSKPKSTILQKVRSKLPKLNFKTPRQEKRPMLIIFAALMLIGCLGIVYRRSNSPAIADADLRQILEDNGDTPTDKRPYNENNYAVAPDLPRKLTIQKLGINARIVRLSARDNSEPKSPQNIYDVGWYENSAKPGETGAALLLGHIRGLERDGVFTDLTRLVPGDEFQLELGDGTIQNYQIVKMEAYTRGQVDFKNLTQSAVDGQAGLNLLTSVASYESNAEVVQQLAVFAVSKDISSTSQTSLNVTQ